MNLDGGASTRSVIVMIGFTVVAAAIVSALLIYFCAAPGHLPCLWR